MQGVAVLNESKYRKGYLGFMEDLFRLPKLSLNHDTVKHLTEFEERCVQAVPAAMAVLLPRHVEAMQKYYGLGCERLATVEIGISLNVTSSWVHQMIQKDLRKLHEVTHFDQLALELSKQGHSSHYLQIASNRATIGPMLEVMQERLKNPKETSSEVQFLMGHKIDCNKDNPCPTCQAQALFAAVGITTQMQSLLAAWNTDTPPDLLDLPISLVLPNLTVRTRNCLRNENIMSLRQLTKKTEAELLRTPNFGRKSLNELKEELIPLGLRIGMQ